MLKTLIRLAATFLVVAGFLGITTSAALADVSLQNVQTTQSATMKIGRSTVNVNDVTSGKITILSYIKARGLTKKEIAEGNKQLHKKGCFDASFPMYNSGLTIYDHFNHLPGINQVDWYYDPWPGEVCWVPYSVSPTGLARRLCGNFMMFIHHRRPPNLVQGRVILVRSDENLHVFVSITKTESAFAACSVPGAAAGGSINDSASSTLRLLLKTVIKTHGSVLAALYSKVAYKLSITFNNKVNAVCVTAPPQSPPAVQLCTDTNATNYGGPFPCTYPPPPPPPPPAPSISISSLTTLNLVAAGKTSGPVYATVYASDPGGSLTIDGGIGSVSSCNSSTPQSSVTFSLSAGNNTECYIAYAPNDADKPPTIRFTYTANLTTSGGTASDVKYQDVAIQYPTRP